MIFLQPFVLWGLPLILAPVLIHLINRMRHKPQRWAAMQFLLAAHRNSLRQSKLRHWWVLACRTVAVLALILAVSRPMSGGWLSGFVSSAPDAVLLLLDCSASMQVPGTGLQKSLRELAIDDVQRTLSQLPPTRLIVFDGASHRLQEFGSHVDLKKLPALAATDSAADFSSMLQSVHGWLRENRPGKAEVWMISDMQKSNWQMDRRVVDRFLTLPQPPRFRVASYRGIADRDSSIDLREVTRHGDQLQVVFDVQQAAGNGGRLPLQWTMNGTRMQQESDVSAGTTRLQHNFPVGTEAGWGSVQLPPDINLENNVIYFSYGPKISARAGVIFSDLKAGRVARRAVDPFESGHGEIEELPSLKDKALVLWQKPLPTGDTAAQLQQFVEEGGVVIFFPPGTDDTGSFAGFHWAPAEINRDQPWKIGRWVETEGLLARTGDGYRLPMDDLEIRRRQLPAGLKSVIASFEDGTPFLARERIGRGEIFACGTVPSLDWSNLPENSAFLPWVQRALEKGAQRLQPFINADCGALPASVRATGHWQRLDAASPLSDPATTQGVYRSGELLLAVNRPAAEDDPEFLNDAELKDVLRGLSISTFHDKGRNNDPFELTSWLSFAILMALLGEGALLRHRVGRDDVASRRPSTTQTFGEAV